MRGSRAATGIRGRSAALALLLSALGLLVFGSASALALPAQFASEGEGAGQFMAPTGIAANQETGNIYIADKGNNRVDEFSADGQFVRSFGYGVIDGKVEAQICNTPGPCLTGIAGSAGGQMNGPAGIAVDNEAGPAHGDVYVEDTTNHRVERFGAEGQFQLTFGGKVNAEPGTPHPNLCLAGESCKAGSSGSGEGEFSSLGRNAIAIAPTGTLYVGSGERIQHFSEEGAALGAFNAGIGQVSLLAADSSGDIYAMGEGAIHGVHKYDGSGKELGSPRDAEVSGLAPAIAIGPGDELIVNDPAKEHVLIYGPSGEQTASVFTEANAIKHFSGGIAFDQPGGALYLLHREPVLVVTLTLPPPGPYLIPETEQAGKLGPTGATLEAKLNPEGSEPTSYHFEYGPSEAYGHSTSEAPLTPGFEDQTASSAVSGLSINSTYHFRVVAHNSLGTIHGPDQTFTTTPPVSIDSQSVSELSSSRAKLSTELNPHGLKSEYRFEYGPTAAYGQSAPVPDGSAGEGEGDATFSVRVEGLSPSTTYHFRVVAHNSLGSASGPDQTFTTRPAEGLTLPDGRAWEMVSPPNKHGSALEAIAEEGGVIEASINGSALTYIAHGPVNEETAGSRGGTGIRQQELAHRGEGGWSTEEIATPHQAPAGVGLGNPSEYKLFSGELQTALVEPEGATPLSTQSTEKTPYLREPSGTPCPTRPPIVPAPSCYEPLVTASNVPPGTEFGGTTDPKKPELFGEGVNIVSATPDLSHVILRSPSSLVEGFENAGQTSLYEWSEGRLEAVSVLPNGEVAASEGASYLGNVNFQVRGAVSADGARVAFGVGARHHLYVRDMARGETVRLDKAAAGGKEPGETQEAFFQMASSDGSRVLFIDTARLTKDSTAKSGAPDLYECEVTVEAEKLACRLKDLSVDPHPGEAASVQGAVIGADEGAQHVYFVAKGALATGAASGSCPQAGEGSCVNLYAVDTRTEAVRLVAVLAEEGDRPDWWAGGNGQSLGAVTSRVSPNGQYLAFMSQRPLTGYDNRDANSGARDQEVYEYDYASSTLSCVSCDPGGQRPAGSFDAGAFPGLLVDRPELWGGQWLAGSIPGWTKVDISHALYQSRYLSNSGRLFFNSATPLVAADQNNTEDVYEYEPQGVGSCTSAPACVALISSGTSEEESAFLDASESGDDVFFMTAAQLKKADTDTALDIYDAHVCADGGCPEEPPPPAEPCGSIAGCRAAQAPQPGIFAAPASESFPGSGNLNKVEEEKAPAKPKPKPKAETRAQKLSKALKACRKKANKAKRVSCERQARKRYGSKAKKSKAKKSARKGRRK